MQDKSISSKKSLCTKWNTRYFNFLTVNRSVNVNVTDVTNDKHTILEAGLTFGRAERNPLFRVVTFATHVSWEIKDNILRMRKK